MNAPTFVDASDYTDVLIIGGGPAGTWAAIAAASQGASVRLYDKGFCGTSGATAPSGNSIWYVPDSGQQRQAAKASRYDMGGQLAEHHWMDRVLEQTWRNIHQLQSWGYPSRSTKRASCAANRCRAPNTCA